MGDYVADIRTGGGGHKGRLFVTEAPGEHRGALARSHAGLCDPIHQVVNMHHVAGGEHTGDIGGESVIHERPVGDRIQRHTGLLREFVLRNQSHRKKQCIAGDDLLSAANRLPPLVNLHRLNRLDTVVTDDALDGVPQLQRDIEIHEALDVVAAQPREIGHDLQHPLDLGPFER